MAEINPFVSVLPGRIRLRHPLLRHRGRHQSLTERLARFGAVEGDPTIGSLLLRYDAGATPAATMEAQVRAEVEAVLPVKPDAPEERTRAHPFLKLRRRVEISPMRRARWQLNRAAKVGAVVSMAVSLAALGTSRKLHAQAGAVFLAMMLTHMAVHWRRTFK